MSAPQGDPAGQGDQQFDRPPMGDSLFGSIMDTLVPDEANPAPADPASAGAGAADPAAPAGTPAGTLGADGAAAAPAADSGGSAEAIGAAAAAPAGDAAEQPPGPDAADGAGAGTADPVELTTKLGELSNSFEERTGKAYQAAALEEVRKEHTAYFAALEKHPRLLVGTPVPAIGRDGTETLKSTEDAKDWQEAVKSILVEEIRERATKSMEDNQQFLDTVHASIKLFQDNPDLIPNSKIFDKDLAERFAKMAEPYELRVEGKLQGYAIPVQPLVEQLRAQLKTERATAAPPAAAPPATPPAGTPPANPVDPPQAGIPSKAGNSGDPPEDYSALFGTLGLPNLRI